MEQVGRPRWKEVCVHFKKQNQSRLCRLQVMGDQTREVGETNHAVPYKPGFNAELTLIVGGD